MKVTCHACRAAFEIAPPTWVLRSGKPFRMQCASCGEDQEVYPTGIAVFGDAGDPPEAVDLVDDEPAPPSSFKLANTLDDSIAADPIMSLDMPVPSSRPAMEMPAPSAAPDLAMPAPQMDAHALAKDPEPALTPSVLDGGTPAPVPSASSGEGVAGSDDSGGSDWLPGVDPEDVGSFAEYRHVAVKEEVSRDAAEILLRQDGEVFAVPDLATLQRWIMEHRVERDDEIADPRGAWTRAAAMPSLAVFFDALEQIEVLSSQVLPAIPSTTRPLGAGGEIPVHTGKRDVDRTMESPPMPTEEASPYDAPPAPGRLRSSPVRSSDGGAEEPFQEDEDTEETLPPVGGMAEALRAFDEALVGDTTPAPGQYDEPEFSSPDSPLPVVIDPRPEDRGASPVGMMAAAAVLFAVAALWSLFLGPRWTVPDRGPVTVRPIVQLMAPAPEVAAVPVPEVVAPAAVEPAEPVVAVVAPEPAPKAVAAEVPKPTR